jgi:hypothetical protein
MSRKSKTPPARAPASNHAAKNSAPDIGRGSWTRKEFCARHHITLNTYLTMLKAGLGPREISLTGKPWGAKRITLDAEAAWEREGERRAISEADQSTAREKREAAKARGKVEA